MYNTQPENLMQHTVECAFTAHMLATVGNSFFNKQFDADKIAAHALFHDVSEVLTGDLPTPVKYYNNDIKNAYKSIEQIASEQILNHLPPKITAIYSDYFTSVRLTDDERKLLKIADKLCAYIKCVTELNAGNMEFKPAYTHIREELEKTESDELHYFLTHCLEAFSLSLDDLKGTLINEN